ncbi:MAG: hypothetical protein V3W34_00325 [Phycisphaerae bacterium]
MASTKSTKVNGNDFGKNGKAMRQMQLAESDARRGLQYRAILMLACQTGFGWVDCSDLRTTDAKRSSSGFPYVDLPRYKSARKVGKPVERRIPLLPSTVKALEALARVNQSQHVFKSDNGSALKPTTCPKEFEKFCQAAGVEGWTFKHLRNVGSNVADEHDLSSRVIDRFHGRVLKGVKRAYLVKSRKPEYLIPLVNLIGAEYLDGETVQ